MSTKTLSNYICKKRERCNICYKEQPICLLKNHCDKCKKKIYDCYERHVFQMCFKCVKCNLCGSREEDNILCRLCYNKFPKTIDINSIQLIMEYSNFI